jgi:hypothetical protein
MNSGSKVGSASSKQPISKIRFAIGTRVRGISPLDLQSSVSVGIDLKLATLRCISLYLSAAFFEFRQGSALG